MPFLIQNAILKHFTNASGYFTTACWLSIYLSPYRKKNFKLEAIKKGWHFCQPCKVCFNLS
jgi:hypothetical protein